jgi:predicted acyl esterase
MPSTAEILNAKFPDLEFKQLLPAAKHPLFNFTGFEQSKRIIPKGHVRPPGKKPFPSDVVFDRDVAISMRDQIKIYADIFRPVDSDTNKVPALIPWSPYGKTGTGPQRYEAMGPFNCGVQPEKTSGYEKFEAPDPAEWCERGYAIVNVDARGAGMSEVNISFFGIQEAEDIYGPD